jgi:predicted enzyme related to lactoylglutathione lyase
MALTSDQRSTRSSSAELHAQSLWASLTVRDLATSLAWYRDVVGFAVEREHRRDDRLTAVSLKAGDVRILLGQDDGAKGLDRPKGEGHSLQIMTSGDIDAIAARIKERGGVLESEPVDTPWGARVFRMKDPDGFRFAISSMPADRAGESPSMSHSPTKALYGWVTHTELASADPRATKAWCEKALGWKFKPSFPVPGGEYHLFTYSSQGGGGIRPNNPPELPGSIPYVHVEDARAAFDKAIGAGAEEMLAPTFVMEGVTVAIVRAPGGVAIGLSGP